MSKPQSLLSKATDLVSDTAIKTGALALSRRAKVEALRTGINWLIKRNHNKPLRLSHDSGYGDVGLMSDGERIELTWWLVDRPQGAAHQSAIHDSVYTRPATSDGTTGGQLPIERTVTSATALEKREPELQPEPDFKTDAKTESTSTDGSLDASMIRSVRDSVNNAVSGVFGEAVGEGVGEEVSNAVGVFVVETVDMVIGNMVARFFDGKARGDRGTQQSSDLQ